MTLAALKIFDPASFMTASTNRLFLCSEGFEERSLTWLGSLDDRIQFEHSFVFRNVPNRESRLSALLPEVKLRTTAEPQVVDYLRYEPSETEEALVQLFSETAPHVDEIVVDISVMSKLLIVMILCGLRNYAGKLSCIYTEPTGYSPTREEYERSRLEAAAMLQFPSYGVYDVVRTPLLASSVMHNRPVSLIAFTSFNEQLIRALLSTLSPTHLYLIGGIPPHLAWRERATQEVHRQILQEYERDNPMGDNELLRRRASTLNYEETFTILAEMYRTVCLSNRIVLAPTGSKMQSVACGILKTCCPDIHIEYPTPESFFVPGFSSREVRSIHHLEMANFSQYLGSIANSYGLNG